MPDLSQNQGYIIAINRLKEFSFGDRCMPFISRSSNLIYALSLLIFPQTLAAFPSANFTCIVSSVLQHWYEKTLKKRFLVDFHVSKLSTILRDSVRIQTAVRFAPVLIIMHPKYLTRLPTNRCRIFRYFRVRYKQTSHMYATELLFSER